MNYYRKIIAIIAALAVMAGCFALPVSATGELSVSDSDASQAKEIAMPEVYTGSAIVIDADTKAVIYEHNAYEQRPMASTTKIMTCLLALEKGELGSEVQITSEMLAYDESGSTKLGLQVGDKITLHDLILGMLLLSGNDCAQATAIGIGGTFDNFASMMNERASEIGMMNTHFITPSGLDADGHFSTAYDMALLAAEAMKNEDFASMCGTKTAKVWYGNPMTEHPLATHNYLLQGMSHGVKGCDGIKTGYTDEAGFCLVSHVQRNGINLICVTLGMPSYWSYQEDLYEYAFSQYVKVVANSMVATDNLTVIGGAKNSVGIRCEIADSFYVLKNQVDYVTSEVSLNRFEYAPITKDQVLGHVTYKYGTMTVAEFPILATENVECVTTDWLSAYIDTVKHNMTADK